jgi:hypothetical protein
MRCATEDERHLIQALGAARYARPDLLCSAFCRTSLLWLSWEAKTSKAFYGLLRDVETGMRTAMAGRLTDYYKQRDWWRSPRVQLTHETRASIASAEGKAKKYGPGSGPEDVESQFSFGLWVALLGRGLNYETQFWRPVRGGFPGFTGRRTQLWRQLDHLRILRNKVAHHDPIGARHLEMDRLSALQVIGYLSPSLAEWTRATTAELQELIQQRPDRCPRPRQPPQ